MEITVKNVKIHDDMSDETMCFSAAIFADGKKVGTAQNAGHGGCNQYHWIDRALGRNVEAWAEKQTMEYDFEKLDQIIDPLVCRFDDERRERASVKRLCKTQTLFRLFSDPNDGSWRTINTPYKAGGQAYLESKYPGQVSEIAGQ